MAGINYETDLNDRLNSLNNHIDINKGRVTNYHGIGGFMGKLSDTLTILDEEINNIKNSYKNYNNALNDVPMPLSPLEVERSISDASKYKYSNKIDEEEIL